MNEKNEQAEREAFEAWANKFGHYPYSASWEAWKARAALSPRQMVADSAGGAGERQKMEAMLEQCAWARQKESRNAYRCGWQDRAQLAAPAPSASPAALTDAKRIAEILLTAWQKAEPGHAVSLYPESYKATFLDMARALLAAQPPAAAEAEK